MASCEPNIKVVSRFHRSNLQKTRHCSCWSENQPVHVILLSAEPAQYFRFSSALPVQAWISAYAKPTYNETALALSCQNDIHNHHSESADNITAVSFRSQIPEGRVALALSK